MVFPSQEQVTACIVSPIPDREHVMIVRERPSALRLFLVVRGSVLPRIRTTLIVNTLIATIVTWCHGTLFDHKVILTTIPFTLIGLPLAIFLGFRNTAAYDRYWEARKLWGELVLRSRNFSRQCQTMIRSDTLAHAKLGLDDVRVRMIYRTIAFCHALRHQLRDTRGPPTCSRCCVRPNGKRPTRRRTRPTT